MSNVLWFLYSVSNYLYRKGIPIIPRLITFFIHVFFNSYVPASCIIGKGTKFAYGGIGVVIHSRAVLGKNCLIGQGVTIGGRSKQYGVPIIGDNVQISAGSRVLGDITLGDNVIVGSNAVVIKDVPNNSVVGGVPAKILKKDITLEDYI